MKPPALGFTLLEMIAVLAVLAVLCTLALPTLAGRMQHERLVAAAQALAGDLAEARFEAAKRGRSLYVQAGSQTSPDGWCWAVATTPTCDCATTPGTGHSVSPCAVKTVHAADHAGVRMQANWQARLDADGTVQGHRLDQGRGRGVTLSATTGEQLRVQISPTGRSTVCLPAGVKLSEGRPASVKPGRYSSC